MINQDQVKVTSRDQEVLNLLVQGCSNNKIRCQLHISQRTVKHYLRMLFLWVLLILIPVSSSAQEHGLWPTQPISAVVNAFHSHESIANHAHPTEFGKLARIEMAAWAADMTTTQIGLLRGHGELNPIFGQHPTSVRLWATSIPLQGLFLYACHRESQAHPGGKFWKAATRVSIGLHAAATVNNIVALR
jgi:hypothetical protein